MEKAYDRVDRQRELMEGTANVWGGGYWMLLRVFMFYVARGGRSTPPPAM